MKCGFPKIVSEKKSDINHIEKIEKK